MIADDVFFCKPNTQQRFRMMQYCIVWKNTELPQICNIITGTSKKMYLFDAYI